MVDVKLFMKMGEVAGSCPALEYWNPGYFLFVWGYEEFWSHEGCVDLITGITGQSKEATRLER